MTQAWQIQPDGSYRRLSETEDLITDLLSTFEDLHETFPAYRNVCAQGRVVRERSRLLMEESKRERRLRTTSLRLVRGLP